MDETERRIRAAMTLAGIDSFEDLARRIDSRNLGATTLRKLNDNVRASLPRRAIADACGLPYQFFTVDFRRLSELAQAAASDAQPERLDALEQQVSQLATDLREVRAELLERELADRDPRSRRDAGSTEEDERDRGAAG